MQEVDWPVEEARLRARLVFRRRQEAPMLAPCIGDVCRLLGLPL